MKNHDLLEMAEALLRQGQSATLSDGLNSPTIRRALSVALAKQELAERKGRTRFLNGELFGEPMWEMLLDLYISHFEERELPVTSLAVGADIPKSTAIRYLATLAERDLIDRYSNDQDRRVILVSLKDAGLEALDRYFAERLNGMGLTVAPVRPAIPLSD